MILLLVYRTSRPHVAVLVPVTSPEVGRRLWLDAARHRGAAPLDDVVVLRVEAGLFFANADHTRDAVRASITPSTRAVVLDCETAPVIDVSAAEMLSQLAKDLARQKVRLQLAKSVGQVRDLLESSGVLTELGELYPTIDAAVEAARASSPGPGGDRRHRTALTGRELTRRRPIGRIRRRSDARSAPRPAPAGGC